MSWKECRGRAGCHAGRTTHTRAKPTAHKIPRVGQRMRGRNNRSVQWRTGNVCGPRGRTRNQSKAYYSVLLESQLGRSPMPTQMGNDCQRAGAAAKEGLCVNAYAFATGDLTKQAAAALNPTREFCRGACQVDTFARSDLLLQYSCTMQPAERGHRVCGQLGWPAAPMATLECGRQPSTLHVLSF